jgi:hypothetical protein
MKNLISIILVLTTQTLLAVEDPDLCSNELLKISNDGKKMNLTSAGIEGYSFQKERNTVTFSQKKASSMVIGVALGKYWDHLEKAELDNQGRVTQITYQSFVGPSAIVNGAIGAASQGQAEVDDSPKTKTYELGYAADGRCFVKSVNYNHEEDQEKNADSTLCRSLLSLLRTQRECTTQAEAKITELFKKYPKVNIQNARLPYMVAAGEQIGFCMGDGYIDASVKDSTLKLAPSTTAATTSAPAVSGATNQ